MLPSETMIWQPEFTDKTLSRKPGAVQTRRSAHSVVTFLTTPFNEKIPCQKSHPWSLLRQ
ncbi:restriction endonuclease [Escherichia coli]|nr:restriction endonuclease [Escherichia coli]